MEDVILSLSKPGVPIRHKSPVARKTATHIEGAQPSGESMGQDKMCWENVPVAAQIPELIVCPDHTQVFMFSAVTWNRHHIHYSKDAAIKEGLPGVVVQRGLIGNFLARLITNWIGTSAELRKLTWKVTRSAQPGKNIVCRGKVKQKTESEDERYLICEVTASSEGDGLIASGDATVSFAVDHARS